jgi:outer membrane protein OmpA-like peptidoglycan-associated protein
MKPVLRKHAPSSPIAQQPKLSGRPQPAGMPCFLRTRRSPTPAPSIGPRIAVGGHGTPLEREADRIAGQFDQAPAPASPQTSRAKLNTIRGSEIAAATSSPGQPLDVQTLMHMESRFGADLGQVRIHTGTQAEILNRDLRAQAFTQGSHIFFGNGLTPGNNTVTAHEIAHVVQHGGGVQRSAVGPIEPCRGEPGIQRYTGSLAVPSGVFDVNMQVVQPASSADPDFRGLDGYIRFVPSISARNSNEIEMMQIAKSVYQNETVSEYATAGSEHTEEGELGDRGLATLAQPARGIEGGFFTDIHHKGNKPRTATSPRYDVIPANSGTTGWIGKVQQPPQYGSGIGAAHSSPSRKISGFKRSDDPADIRSVAMYDRPGCTDLQDVSFYSSFETVVRGMDTQFTYGSVKWGFSVSSGIVYQWIPNVYAGASATFGEAQERHRDFYLHEPVTFHFPLDSTYVSVDELEKIPPLVQYLARNQDVNLFLDGFADVLEGPTLSDAAALSSDRAIGVRELLITYGVEADRICGTAGHGASTAATFQDAGKGDQNGTPDEDDNPTGEENRWPNRRVLLTFSQRRRAPDPLKQW